jgi:prepilin-type N-terminal cleavage/methylation domain-containing protein
VGRPRGRSARRRDGGFSLVEVVVTITLLGVVVAPILMAVTAGIRSSSLSLTAAEVETVLVNSVDRVNRSPREGVLACSLTGPVESAVETHGWPRSSATVGHEYLDSSGVWQSDVSGSACPTGGFQNGLVQRFTITITSPEHNVSRTLQVVRSGEDDI